MADGQVHRITKSAHEGLTAALIAAQRAFGAIGKTAKGARAKYAPLDEVLESVRPILNANEIAVTQITEIHGELMAVRSILQHISGETLESLYPVCAIGKAPQDTGSALTYARRYSLLAICGVHPSDEDDDGEKGARVAKREEPPQQDDGTAELLKFKAEALARVAKCDTHEALDRLRQKIEAGVGFKTMQERLPRDANRLLMAIEERHEELGPAHRRTPVEADEIPY